MNRGHTVYSSSKGKATYQWTTSKHDMYLITFNDGRELWTNSMAIIKEELSAEVQLKLF